MFRRGLKKWCEDESLELRSELGVRPQDPIDLDKIAEKYKSKVIHPSEVPGLQPEDLDNLLNHHAGAWSAVTIASRPVSLIILNSAHSLGRMNSSLAHELSHLILDHEPSNISVSHDGLLILSNYDKICEAEADWLGGCLLLPRPALLYIKSNYKMISAAAKKYGVSTQMLTWRMNISGVNRQFGHK